MTIPQDHWIAMHDGKMFTRTFEGENDSAIVLLHDSIGCVDLWRDFSEALCHTTGRRVIALDRPGFGRSDACDTPMPRDFVYTACRTQLPPLLDALAVESFILFGHSVGDDAFLTLI
jgi:pimeloyl-ACP methyl ester carboxylesterase